MLINNPRPRPTNLSDAVASLPLTKRPPNVMRHRRSTAGFKPQHALAEARTLAALDAKLAEEV